MVFATTLMSVALAATHTPTAEGEPDTFDGTATYDWFMEDQNAETFYLDSAEDLMGFVAIVNNDYQIEGDSTFSGKTVVLDANIDLQSMIWNPIGPGVTMGSSFGADYYFAGTFDGNGHTISNMTFKTVDNLWTYGMFGMSLDIIVKNLTLDGVRFDLSNVSVSQPIIGGIIANPLGNTTITGCSVNIDSIVLNGFASNSTAIVGGMVGVASTATQDDCKLDIEDSETTITSFTIGNNSLRVFYAGGMIGEIQYCDTSVSRCTTYVNLDIDGPQVTSVGGILGYVTHGSDLTIDQSSVSGSIEVHDPDNICGVGGFVGWMYPGGNGYTAELSKCVSFVRISSNGYVGGLVGASSSEVLEIECSSFNGSMTFADDGLIGNRGCGGLVGYLANGVATVTSCHSSSDIASNNDDTTQVGALIGTKGPTSNVTFSNCTFINGFDPVGTDSSLNEGTTGFSNDADPVTIVECLNANGGEFELNDENDIVPIPDNVTVTFDVTPSDALIIVTDERGVTTEITSDVVSIRPGLYTVEISKEHYDNVTLEEVTFRDGTTVSATLREKSYTVSFDITPDHATVALTDEDGMAVVVENDVATVTAGRYHVTIEAYSYMTWEEDIEVSKDCTIHVDLDQVLFDVTFEVTPENASILVLSSDGSSMEVTAGDTIQLSPGDYTFIISAPNHTDMTVIETISGDTVISLDLTFAPPFIPFPPQQGGDPIEVWPSENGGSTTTDGNENGTDTLKVVACAAAAVIAAILIVVWASTYRNN